MLSAATILAVTTPAGTIPAGILFRVKVAAAEVSAAKFSPRVIARVWVRDTHLKINLVHGRVVSQTDVTNR